ncbi:response regulator transcription factor [Alicyclobacillus sp. SO9]|uniref:response regulator transcription factor n=1 Tax=Alicyclobacillus sp. SO9 TaxID=2665646 RepID=UPI0018E78745|nr:response regulator transcription factor [Alicyclobacillus sp. SO9]QQE79328.1 response regulator transcription factor [Alicyclobacillus sp. SO9]
MDTGTVLLVEDDPGIVELLSMYLERQGFSVITEDGWAAVDKIQKESVDIVLLDVMLPSTNGYELCEEFRRHSDVPILFVSAKSEDADKILGLSLGADDFIEKPFSPSEVVARVKANLRRYRNSTERTPEEPPFLYIGGMEIDEDTFTVRDGNRTTVLTAKEFQLLKLLAQNPDKIYKPDELYDVIWRSDSFGDVRTVMVHISNLRKKIEPDPTHPKYIVTIRGTGYKFIDEHEDAG